MNIITFFNNKDGVGKTSLLYHTAQMFANLGHRTMVVDADPQANLSQMCLEEDRFIELIDKQQTLKHALKLIEKKQGDISDAHSEPINENLWLLVGDLDLSLIEDNLSKEWYECLSGEWYPFALQTALYRIIKNAAEKHNIDYVFIDVGPNFGAINRTVLISSEYLIIPSTADLFSLKGLSNIGERIANWFKDWEKRLSERNDDAVQLSSPTNKIYPLGYVLMQHGVSSDKPLKAYKKFADRLPETFRKSFFPTPIHNNVPSIEQDPYCLALVKHYSSLMPMAMEVRKPIFMLKPADGAIGAHFNAVKKVYNDFEQFANNIIKHINQHQAEKQLTY